MIITTATIRNWRAAVALAAVLALVGCASEAPTTVVVFPRASINGEPTQLQLDTGSSTTWLLSAGAKRAGLKFAPPPPDDVAQSVKGGIDMGLSDPTVVTVGTETFTAQLPVWKPSWLIRTLIDWDADGLIGWPEIRDNILVFDSEQRTIRGVDTLPPETAGWLKLKVRPDGVLLLETPLPGGKTGVILVDTGSPLGVGLSSEQWKAWRTAHPKTPVTSRSYFMPSAGMVSGKEAWAEDVSVGALNFTDMPVQEAPPAEAALFADFAGTLGMYALTRMDLVVDAKNGVAYAHPRPPPGPPYPGLKRPGMTNDMTKHPFENDDWIVADSAKLKSDNLLVFSGQFKYLSGDTKGGLMDWAHALELNPTNIEVFLARGDAREATGDDAGAIDDYSRALKLDPTNGDTLLARGATRQIQGDIPNALADYGRAIELKPDDSQYPALYRQLLLLRTGIAPTNFGATAAGWTNGWAKDLGRYVAGQINEKTLLKAAKKSDLEPVSGQKCEAFYFIGMMRLIAGDHAGAREYFEMCATTGQVDYYEYKFSRAELTRMGVALPK